jgi:surface polysaccharide O-acyltransferase-like enzyme
MNRNHAIDFIKGISLLFIAGLHINIFNNINNAANFSFNTIMRFAVPFFFLTSGYLLFQKLKKSVNVQQILITYILRITKYYVVGLLGGFFLDRFVFSLITKAPFVYLSSVNYRPGFTSGTFLGDLLYYGLGILSGIHLWFLIAMVWSAIMIFLFCRKNVANIRILTGIALVIHVVGLFGLTQPYSHFAALPLYTRDGVFFGLFYMCLGGFWAMYGMDVKKYIPSKWILPAIFLFSLLQIAERAAMVFPFNEPWHANWGEYFITTIPLTVILFQYALDNSTRFANNLFTKIGEQSIGVYILHLAIIRTIRIVTNEVLQKPELWQNIWFQLAVPVVTIAVAYLVYTLFLQLSRMIFSKKAQVYKA